MKYKKTILLLLIAFAFVSLSTSNITQAQFSNSFWIFKGGQNVVTPLIGTWNIRVPGMATSTTGCVSVNANGDFLPSGVVCPTGSGDPGLIYQLNNGTTYFTSSSSDAFGFLFKDGFVSQASSTIDGALTITGVVSHTDNNITNVGQIDLDTIVSDGNDITINPTNNTIFTSGTKVLIGHTSALQISNNSPFQIAGTSGALASMSMSRWSNSASGVASYNVFKSRSGTIGVNTIVQDNDNVGQFKFLADDGADFDTKIAVFSAEVDDANPATGIIGGAMVFATGNGTDATPVEVMRLASDGLLTINKGFISQASSTIDSTLRITSTTTIDGHLTLGTTTPHQDAVINIEIDDPNEHGLKITTAVGQVEHPFSIENNAGRELLTVGEDGDLEIDHIEDSAGSGAFHIDNDINGFPDIAAIVINTILTGLQAEESAIGISHVVNSADSASGSSFETYGCFKVGSGSASLGCLAVGSGLNVIHQDRGTSENASNVFLASSTFLTFADITAAANSASIDVELVVADDDYFVIGFTSQFGEFSFDFDTPSGKNIFQGVDNFQHSATGDTWVDFQPNDLTDGLTESAPVRFDVEDIAADWTTATVNSVSGIFWIRFQRTRNNIQTTPIENLIQITTISESDWDEFGNIHVEGFFASSTSIFGGLITADGGFISTASSTFGANLNITGALSASSTVAIGGLLTVTGLTSAGIITDANGLFAEYAGTSCTNQFVRSLSALMAATCATVSLTADVTGTLPIANGGTNATSLDDILGTTNQLTVTNGANTIIGGNATLSIPSLFVIQQASTTIFSATDSFFGGTATTTIGTDGSVALPASATLTVPDLTSALILTNGSGVFAEYTGVDCTNQFIRDLDVLGAGTCATVVDADVANDITIDSSTVVTAPNFAADSGTATSTFAGGLTIETTGFVYDFSTNNVGIGTSTPEQILVIESNNPRLMISDSSSGPQWELRNENGDFKIFTTLNVDSAEFTILSSGFVGIGDDTPDSELNIEGTDPLLWIDGATNGDEFLRLTEGSDTFIGASGKFAI